MSQMCGVQKLHSLRHIEISDLVCTATFLELDFDYRNDSQGDRRTPNYRDGSTE